VLVINKVKIKESLVSGSFSIEIFVQFVGWEDLGLGDAPPGEVELNDEFLDW
jgi:hypothetical protein